MPLKLAWERRARPTDGSRFATEPTEPCGTRPETSSSPTTGEKQEGCSLSPRGHRASGSEKTASYFPQRATPADRLNLGTSMRGFQATAARSLCSAALAFFLVGYDGDYEDDRGYSEYEDYANWYREQKEEAEPSSGEFAQWLKDAEKRYPPTLRLPEYDRRERVRKGTEAGRGSRPLPHGLEER